MENKSRKKVLVTGCSGFTGRHLIQELKMEGYQPVEFTHKGCSIDLRDKNIVNGVLAELKFDCVIHLAGISFTEHVNTGDFYEVNVIGTKNLLDALVRNECKVERVILASTASVYGNKNKRAPISENDGPEPISHYGASKLAMEFMARLYSKNFPIIITRPFNYTGVGQKESFLVPKIVNAFKRKEETLKLGNIDVVRDFSDVRDVVKIYVNLLLNGRGGDIVNICSGKGISIREVIGICEKITNHKINIISDEDFRRENDIYYLVGNADKLNSITRSRNFNMSETIEWMLNSGD